MLTYRTSGVIQVIFLTDQSGCVNLHVVLMSVSILSFKLNQLSLKSRNSYLSNIVNVLIGTPAYQCAHYTNPILPVHIQHELLHDISVSLYGPVLKMTQKNQQNQYNNDTIWPKYIITIFILLVCSMVFK